MKNLNCLQRKACRSNPLAAYLAHRMPALLMVTGVILTLNILAVLLAASYAAGWKVPLSLNTIHHLAAGLSFSTLLCGALLAAEMTWMIRHGIGPANFERSSSKTSSGRQRQYETELRQAKTPREKVLLSQLVELSESLVEIEQMAEQGEEIQSRKGSKALCKHSLYLFRAIRARSKG